MMNSKTNLPVSSRLKPPATVTRRATLATCRSRPNESKSALTSRVSNISKTTTAAVAPIKRTTTTKPVQRTLKRQISNSENEPAAKVSKKESSRPITNRANSKRNAWDYKGRLNDMEEYVHTVSDELQTNNGRLKMLESRNSQLEGNVVTKEKEFEEASSRSKDLQARLDSLSQSKIEMERTYKVEIDNERDEKDRIDRENEEFKFELDLARNEIKTLKQKNSLMATEALAVTTELQATKVAFAQSKIEMERKYKVEIDNERDEKDRIDREKEEFKFELDLARNEIKTFKQKISLMATEALAVITELQATKVAFAKTMEDNRQQAHLITSLQTTVASHTETIASCEEKLRAEESVRRQLHNTVQELKGNIRVFCRVRPSLLSEKDATLTKIEFQTETNMVLSQQNENESICGGRRQATKFPFTFDKVFPESSAQNVVFSEISQLIQSALDGYNVCIFAYGQTGSGKTYTMEGDLRNRDLWGMIPRALEQVFLTCESLKSKGWQYKIKACFLEIYNEAIRDLLGSGDPNVKHDIKLVSNNGTQANEVVVTNLRTVAVTSSDQVSSLLQKACDNRAVAATNCNERSSRSHSVFRLKMSGVNHITEERCQGTLNLVDLAGSERLSQSGSTGARLKETQNINKSLSNLGIVITSLANKEQHIPFRNSKLTYLLQNSLGGNSKSLMFVNISPREDSFQETLSSLRFATKVNTCNIGTAQKAKKI